MESRSFLPFRLAARFALLALALALVQGPLAGAATAQAEAPAAAGGDPAASQPGAATGSDTATGERATPPPPPVSPPPPPPPPPPPEPLAVYIAVSGTTTGPFDRSQLVAMIADGALTEATMVWQAGMADWLPAGQVEAVAGLIAAARATPGPATETPAETLTDTPTEAPTEAPAVEEPDPGAAAQPATRPEPKPVPGWGPRPAPDEAAAETPGESSGGAPAAGDGGATSPQPPQDAAAEPAGLDPARFVLGTWQSDAAELAVPDLGTSGSFTGTATYQPDGAMRLEGVLRVTVNGVPLSISMIGQGSYRVVEASAGESFTITPDAQMTLTVPGYPPQTEAMTDPATYLVLDPDTMRDTEGVTWRRR